MESGCRGPSLDPTARGAAGLGRGLVPWLQLEVSSVMHSGSPAFSIAGGRSWVLGWWVLTWKAVVALPVGGTQDKESMSQKAEWLGAQLSAG